MRLNFDTDWFNNNILIQGQSNNPKENYLFLNVMVNFVIVNQKLTGSALHIEKKIGLYLPCRVNKGWYMPVMYIVSTNAEHDF